MPKVDDHVRINVSDLLFVHDLNAIHHIIFCTMDNS